ncbi:MAG: DMT family transporter [Pseudomonadota bacterium]
MIREKSALKGIVLVTAAVGCFAALDTVTKYVTASVPLIMALWFRYFFQAVATSAAILPSRGLSILRTEHPKFQCLRGLLLLTSSFFAFLSLRYMPVAEFTSIVAIVPLVITLFAAINLGERVSLVRWLLVLGGFAGTLIIIRPGSSHFGWHILLPLVVVGTNSWFQILTSRLARTEDPITMHLYTGWVGTLAVSILLPFVWTQLDSWSLWALLVFMGAAATAGHFMLILAYGQAPAGTLTPYMYTQIGFAMIGGWLLFSHVPDRWSLAGMLIIAICGVIGAWLTSRESSVSRRMPTAAVAK